MSEEAIEVATDAFTPDHSCIAIYKNLRGTLYWTYGRFSEAESLFGQALGIYERGLDSDPPKVVAARNSLGEFYQDQRKDTEVLYLFKNNFTNL